MDINVLATIFKFILFVVEIYYFGMIIYFFTSWYQVLEKLGRLFFSQYMNLSYNHLEK